MAACFSESEVGIHSPQQQTSEENVEVSEAKAFTGQVEMSMDTKSCDVCTDPLGHTADLVDNNSATWQNASNDVAKFCDKQTDVATEAANVDLNKRLTNLGLDDRSCVDLFQPQMEVDDDNHGQRSILAELSFRMDSPSNLGSELGSSDASNNILLTKGIEGQANFGANHFATEGPDDILVLQCESEIASKKLVVKPAPSAHIDGRKDRILNDNGAAGMDLVVYTPDANNTSGRKARELDTTNAGCIDEKLMKIGGIELRKPSFLMQSNARRISSLLRRDYQSQVFSSRSKYESAVVSREDKRGTELGRSITYPRAPQVQTVFRARTQEKEEAVDEEDLYLPQGLLPDRMRDYKSPFYKSDHQNVSYLEEEELYSVLMNDKGTQRQGFTVGSSFPSQSDLYSDGADSNTAMKEHFPYRRSSSHLSSSKVHSLQNPTAEGDGYVVDQLDYSSVCFAGPHEHPHMSQNFRCHSNEQYPVDLYCSQVPSANGACALPMALHQFTGSPFASQNDISPAAPPNYTPNMANLCYNQHPCLQLPSHMHSSGQLHFCAPTFSQHLPMSYQPWQIEGQCLQHSSSYGRCPRNLPQRGLHKQQLHGGAAPMSQFQSHACLARKENCPPLPGVGAPPYVLCQGCNKILQVPTTLHNKRALQRIRCSACGRTSKFCNVLHPHYQALLEDRLETGSAQTAYGNPLLNQHRLHATSARVGVSEQVFAYDARKVPMPASLDRNLRSSCGYSGQYDRMDKYSVTQSGAAPISNHNTEKLDSFCHSRLAATMPMEQQPCESEWRNGMGYGLFNGSGMVRESYPSYLPSFIVNGSHLPRQAAVHPSHKMQQLKASGPQHAELEASSAPKFADGFIQERSDSRVRVSSGEIQGLSLGCPQEGSCDGSLLIERVDQRSLQQGHGNGAINNCANGISHSPAPGSLLHEHLSYDTASEFGKLAHKHEEKGKQADPGSYVQESCKGSKFLSGLLKKNIRELGKGPGSNKGWKVVVNGQMLPIAAVKSAEKQAGAIRPGVYWYDYQAGFWGVMGGPCLGIIPPSIAEFNFPLAKECAGGTTGIFVNGRELHKKDLDVLAGRGLPKTRGKAYMVDISGQVIDQASGQLLRSLGRLAPTIERKGRGCGMFQPPSQS